MFTCALVGYDTTMSRRVRTKLTVKYIQLTTLYRIDEDFRLRAHVQVHVELTRLSVHPGLHDAHFSAPFTGQCVPVCPTPLWHVHVFATKCKDRLSQASEQVFLTLRVYELGLRNASEITIFCVGEHMQTYDHTEFQHD